MKFAFRRMLVSLVAVFALGVLASASASAALPEFSGTIPTKFTSSVSGATIEGADGSIFTFDASITGEIVGVKEVSKVVIKFTKGNSGLLCWNKGTSSWETKELKGRIGYVNKATHLVGLLLEPVKAPFAECEVYPGGLDFGKFLGSVIGQIGQVGQKTKSHTLSFRESFSKGYEELKKFEGEELTHNLEWKRHSESILEPKALISEMSLTTPQTMEIQG